MAVTALNDTPINDFPQPPPPPPPPKGKDDEAKRIDEQLRLAKERKRELRKQNAMSRLRNVHPSHMYLIGGIVVAGAAFLGVRSLLGFQRDTALALADARAAAVAPVAESGAQVVQGIENPLEQLALTGRARWNIGVQGPNNELKPLRSSIVVADLMEQLDLCSMFVGVNDLAELDVATDPLPGYVPLVESVGGVPCPGATGSTAVQTPADPAPSTSVPGA